jgi:hypothetical protein
MMNRFNLNGSCLPAPMTISSTLRMPGFGIRLSGLNYIHYIHSITPLTTWLPWKSAGNVPLNKSKRNLYFEASYFGKQTSESFHGYHHVFNWQFVINGTKPLSQ